MLPAALLPALCMTLLCSCGGYYGGRCPTPAELEAELALNDAYEGRSVQVKSGNAIVTPQNLVARYGQSDEPSAGIVGTTIADGRDLTEVQATLRKILG